MQTKELIELIDEDVRQWYMDSHDHADEFYMGEDWAAFIDRLEDGKVGYIRSSILATATIMSKKIISEEDEGWERTGDEIHVVFSIRDPDGDVRYIRKTGKYNSLNDDDYGWPTEEVTPVTMYETVEETHGYKRW